MCAQSSFFLPVTSPVDLVYGIILPANCDLILADVALPAHRVGLLERIPAVAGQRLSAAAFPTQSPRSSSGCAGCCFDPAMGFKLHTGFSFPMKWQKRWVRRSSSPSSCPREGDTQYQCYHGCITISCPMDIDLHANTWLIFFCWGHNCCLWLYPESLSWLLIYLFIYVITLPCWRAAILDADHHYFVSVKWA